MEVRSGVDGTEGDKGVNVIGSEVFIPVFTTPLSASLNADKH